MNTLLITGSNGQLGSEMRAMASLYPDYRFLFTDVDTLDITDLEALTSVVRTEQVNYIINCAAYTAVDKAETDRLLAYRINAEAVQNLGIAAAEVKARVIHVSTDYVFNGRNCRPYVETDPIDPQSVYGQTKAEGEQLLFAACPDSIVVRTAWLYSTYGNNFVKTMMKLGAERSELKVVFDQVGTPTYAADLASVLLTMVSHAGNEGFRRGTYHFSNEGVCSWYDFALAIHRRAGINGCRIRPVESTEYPTAAARPSYSVLNKSKIKSTFELEITHWEEALCRFFVRMEQPSSPIVK